MKKILTVLFCFCYSLTGMFAQNDDWLDPSFNFNGKVINQSANEEIANAVAVQSDGKIVVAGSVSKTATFSRFILLRYNTDGSIDTNFGIDGRVETTISGTEDVINSILIQSDGKIVVGGTSWSDDTRYDYVIARYNSNGTLDNTFGNNGVVVFDVNGDDEKVNSIAIQDDGKIIAGGFGVYNFMLLRLKADGSIDSTFGFNGVGFTDMKNGSDRIRALAIQSDGKIVAAGVSDAQNTDMSVVRYKTDGFPDSTFGTNGIVVNNQPNGAEQAYSVAVQSDGKIISLGTQDLNGKLGVYLIRYTANGTLDADYGVNGIVRVSFSDNEEAFSSVLQSDGKLVVAGYSYISSDQSKDFLLLRFNQNGTLDDTFGSGGRINTDFLNNDDDIAFGIARQTDGKLVAAGFTQGIPDIAIARYYPESKVSVEDFEIYNQIFISPNPSNDFIEISISESSYTLNYMSEDVHIFNTLGLKVKSIELKSSSVSRIDISNLTAGVYYIKIGDKVEKFVKK